MADAPPPQEPKLDAIRGVLEHIQFLWDDQVKLAETLVEKRKTQSSVLAIVIGLGAFRIQFTQRPDEIPTLAETSLMAVQILLSAALLSFVAGSYFLLTQRQSFRRVLWLVINLVASWAIFLYRKARKLEQHERDAIQLEKLEAGLEQQGRASDAGLPEDEAVEDWLLQDEVTVLRMRTERLTEAYRVLKQANDRVSKRLRWALFWLFSGYFLVFCTLIVYVWSMGGQR